MTKHFLKQCKICGKYTIINESFWIGDKNIIRESCTNPLCKSYKPYVNYTIKNK